jgi:hypothetical protein
MAKKPTWPSTYIEDLSPVEKRKLLDAAHTAPEEISISWKEIALGILVIGAIVVFVLIWC